MALPWLGIRGAAGYVTRRSYAGVVLADSANATFSRSTSRTYLTGATSIATANTNVLRYENRGDGNGSVPLYEDAATNTVSYSNLIGSWTPNGSNTGTSNATTSPDGTNNAGNVTKPSTPGTGPYLALNIGAIKEGCFSVWAKNNTGGTSTRLRFSFATGIALPITLTSGWARYDAYASFTGAANDYISFDHRADVPNTGDPAISVVTDYYVYGVQLEAARKFPSTLVPSNSGVATTGSADTETYSTSQYNAALLTAPWQFTFYPRWAPPTDVTDGDARWFWSFGDSSNGIYADTTSGVTTIVVKVGGAVKVQSSGFTCSRHQGVTVTVRPGSGILTLAGATTGNGSTTGTAFAFPAANLRKGGIYGGANEACARISMAVGV